MPPTADSSAQIPSLSTAQRNLLQQALVSNKRNRQTGRAAAPTELVNNYFPTFAQAPALVKAQDLNFDSVNPAIFDVSQENFPTSGYDSTFDDSLLSTYNDNSGIFDFGSTATNPQQTEEHDKRKSPNEEDDDDDDESDHKRQEGDDKVAKKPGRKLIMAEPTTKRKAQNRAAQRAFRERKEKHLKDLEEKVGHLEKSSEATNHENAVLRAQLARMQSELSDYKKRLSSTAGLSNSPPSAAFQNFNEKSRSSGGSSDFNFDFTKFGSSATLRQTSTESSSSNAHAPSRNNSRSLSPSQQQQNSMLSSWTPSSNNASNGQANVNSSFLNNLSNLGNVDFSSTTAQDGATKCPSLCQSDTRSSGASPEASTPDASYSNYTDSPAAMPELGLTQSMTQTDKNADPLAFDFTTFGDDHGFAQFNNTNTNLDFGIDWLANQNGGQFDPVLFNDYRESQDAIIGGGDFSGGFFDENFNIPTMSSNFNFDLSPQTTNLAFQVAPTPAPAASKTACQSLMEKVEACRNGEVGDNDGLALPASDKTGSPDYNNGFTVSHEAQMMTAHKIWTELQSCPKFQRGELDIDSLCSELSKKATCSETGLQVPKEVVEATLWKLVGDSEESAQLMDRIGGNCHN